MVPGEAVTANKRFWTGAVQGGLPAVRSRSRFGPSNMHVIEVFVGPRASMQRRAWGLAFPHRQCCVRPRGNCSRGHHEAVELGLGWAVESCMNSSSWCMNHGLSIAAPGEQMDEAGQTHWRRVGNIQGQVVDDLGWLWERHERDAALTALQPPAARERSEECKENK